jgi:ketosteroid isomerase-like protein
MKRIFVLMFIAAMGIFSTARFASPRISTVSAASPARSFAGESMDQQVVAKEREGLDALKVNDLDRFAKLTADDAVFVDAHGTAGKAQVLKNVVGFSITDYTMDNVQFLQISPNTGLISYKLTEKGMSHDKSFAAQVYVSSIWAQRGENWVCVFSQETAARQ